MDFLAEMFELGFEYSTINTHRSAISAFHEPIEGFSVGKFATWYSFVWDNGTVPSYLRSLPMNKLLSSKMLTLKLRMLLTSTCQPKDVLK